MFPLCQQVVVAAETGGALGGMVRQLSIDQFENEGRRVSYGTPESATAARKLLDRQMSINSVPKKVLIARTFCIIKQHLCVFGVIVECISSKKGTVLNGKSRVFMADVLSRNTNI